ncbi:MAG TPA: serine/threonine-protein kinase [Polyangiaceae bacterium]|nr:serine/threonine-protein kinase [Polyangiaceae bacterium]
MSDLDLDDDDPLIGATVADRYRIERRLGQGGMGTVYLAEHVRMHKPFAVKVLHQEMGRLAEAVFRFEREAIAAGRVDHQHLVTATDFGKLPDGSMYLVLEYVPGRNLATVMGEGPMSQLRALRIARQIAAGLAAIHGVGIVHRDLKPDNIMLVERPDNEDFVKLLDFGMAKVLMDVPPEQAQVTRAGLVFGTPRYMAPEQAAGEPTDHRADLYALGVLLYAMLKGVPPFTAEEIRDVLRMQRYDPPPPLPPSVAPNVAGLVMTLLAKDPAERVQTAEGIIEYIDKLVTQLTSLPPPPTVRDRVVGFLRTRSGLVALGAVAATTFATTLLVARSSHNEPAPVPAVATAPAAAPSVAAAPASSSASRSAAELESTLVRAEVGDAVAWKALEARPDAGRGAREWFVLGVARITHGDSPRGFDAYLHAAEADAKYANHARVLRDLMLGARGDAWQDALRVAAALPSSAGPDILFDTWASNAKATNATQRARDLLVTDATRARASDAVRIAFDLRSAQGTTCEVRVPLVKRAATTADSRSLRPLLILASRSGCGLRQRRDCFPCLRTDDSLNRAIERAENTPAPDYSRIIASK